MSVLDNHGRDIPYLDNNNIYPLTSNILHHDASYKLNNGVLDLNLIFNFGPNEKKTSCIFSLNLQIHPYSFHLER